MKVFSLKAAQLTAIAAGLAGATVADTSAFIPAGQMLRSIQQASNGLKKDILATALRIVAGQPCGEVLPVLTALRASMKEAKAAGDSSVGTVRAAVAALAARHGPSHPCPQWASAAQAREAQKAAETAPVDPNAADAPPQATAEEVQARQAAELEELRAIAVEARRALALSADASLADVLASLRTVGVQESVEVIEVSAEQIAERRAQHAAGLISDEEFTAATGEAVGA